MRRARSHPTPNRKKGKTIMTDVMQDPDVRHNADGSYTIVDSTEGGLFGDWTIVNDPPNGWQALHAEDGFGEGIRFASARDAIQAVLGDPADTVLFGGRRYREAVR